MSQKHRTNAKKLRLSYNKLRNVIRRLNILSDNYLKDDLKRKPRHPGHTDSTKAHGLERTNIYTK